nr:integrase, catalytic region, zinc finger, CCHC-type, peptidase aspartic, catalytic [Tanacetum cinerariifolium]
MFRINPSKTSREENQVPNTVSASARTKSITVSLPPVITKKDMNSDLNGLSSTGVDNTKTRRPQPRSNTKHDRVPSASKSSRSKNKEAEVEEHHRNLLLSKNNKHISSACNNIKIDSHDEISKKQKAKVSFKENQMKYQPKVTKPKKVERHKSLATPKPRKSRLLFRWSPTGKLFDNEGKIVDSIESKSQLDCSNDDNACTSNILEPKIKRFPNSTSLLDRLFRFVYGASIWLFQAYDRKSKASHQFCLEVMGTVRFGNDHVAAILGFGNLQWGNILITRVYFVEGLCHNLFSVGKFCDSDLEVAFRRDACFVKNLEGVDLLKGDRSTNLYIINLYEMASACFTKNRSIIHRRFNKTPYELINGRKPNISLLHVFGALCYPKNDCEDIGKLGAKGDIGFFIGYSTDSCAYRVYNRQTKKIMETKNVSLDELSAMAFEQRSSKTRLNSMTSGHISSGLDLTYALSTITTQQPFEGELDLLFEAMYDDYIGGQLSVTARTILSVQEPQVR